MFPNLLRLAHSRTRLSIDGGKQALHLALLGDANKFVADRLNMTKSLGMEGQFRIVKGSPRQKRWLERARYNILNLDGRT